MKANKERKGKHNFIFKRSEEGNQMHLSFINLSSYKKGGKKIVLKIPKIVQGFIFYLKKKKKVVQGSSFLWLLFSHRSYTFLSFLSGHSQPAASLYLSSHFLFFFLLILFIDSLQFHK